jgi:hypothetical protein
MLFGFFSKIIKKSLFYEGGVHGKDNFRGGLGFFDFFTLKTF